MLINLAPIKEYREFRLLFFGQFVSLFGSMITYIAIPYQVYELTKSSFLVGMLGAVQLIPLLVFGVLGGATADRLDRRKLLIFSEIGMSIGAFILMLNSLSSHPRVWLIFVAAGLMQALNGFHRPAMDSLNQKLVQKKDYAAVGALGSFRFSVGAIAGPALGGVIIASFGIHVAYLFDFFTFMFALLMVLLMKSQDFREEQKQSPLQGIKEGFVFAIKRPELMGTYIIDFVAMAFAFPIALFPAMAESLGGAKAAGLLFSAMSIGSLFMTLFSGWTSKVRHHGRAVVISASLWGLAILALGFSGGLTGAVLCLVFAGAADMVSGLFRGVIWNETIPNEMRGRLAGLEMISYMSGPLIGNARAGWVASVSNIKTSVISGGAICFLGVVLTACLLPKFWKYRSHQQEGIVS